MPPPAFGHTLVIFHSHTSPQPLQILCLPIASLVVGSVVVGTRRGQCRHEKLHPAPCCKASDEVQLSVLQRDNSLQTRSRSEIVQPLESQDQLRPGQARRADGLSSHGFSQVMHAAVSRNPVPQVLDLPAGTHARRGWPT